MSPDKNRAELEDKIRSLLVGRRDLVENLQKNYRRYYKNLQTLEFTEQKLAALTTEYANFLDEHLFWIRSSRIIGSKDLSKIPSAVLKKIPSWRPCGHSG